MPTENRSSNTEMVSVPTLLAADNDREMLEYLQESLETQTYGCDQCGHEEPLSTFDIASDLRDYMLAFPQAPASHTHPEPIAWMVGTAFWWTKEEAERDAAATGLPIVGLGPMAGAVPAEKYQGDPVGWQVRSKTNRPESQWTPWKECCEMTRAMHSHEVGRFNQFGIMREIRPVFASAANPGEVERCEARLHEVASLCASVEQERDTLRAQVAERDALLHEIRGQSGSTWLRGETQHKLDAALSASAEPSAPGVLPRAHDVNMFQRTAEPGAKS